LPWINLDTIPAAEFRHGYKPADYHDIIIASRDSQFMFPSVIQPSNFNLQNKAELVQFFNKNGDKFNFKKEITALSRYSFMPGPGEIRPTHIVLRYNLYHESQLADQVVLKIVHPKFGFQEYARQKMLYDIGYPTPRPYLFLNYFSDLEAMLRKKNQALKDLDVRYQSSSYRV